MKKKGARRNNMVNNGHNKLKNNYIITVKNYPLLVLYHTYGNLFPPFFFLFDNKNGQQDFT